MVLGIFVFPEELILLFIVSFVYDENRHALSPLIDQ